MEEPAKAVIVFAYGQTSTAFFFLAITKRGLSDGQKCLISRPDPI